MPENAGALPRLSDLSGLYDGVLSDVWGVVHNGITPYPSAVEALVAFRRAGGHVVLITNAARTTPHIVQMLDDMGVPREAYDAMVTSGDVTRALIATYKGQSIHHVGPGSDHPILEGLDVAEGPAATASAVVVTGLDDPAQTPDDYETRMGEWLELGLPMICANPDKVVEVGDKMVYCAGALADIYAARGGTVALAGKPYPPIYKESLAALEKAAGRAIDPRRVVAIGDSVRTDATGAADAGVDFLFITGSIHADEIDAFGNPDPEAIKALVAPTGARLAGFQSRLT
ncbi:TIGR01459 family HAD-type hydrolase [Mariluticola halotolerans]|uniref:TIGR01459 family HAD-type hydrolase n=1 Tax=Mariluticola halotolerans TaxID=2909283 RepID=UPI0026E477E0|nr:TIGR01459 family HAD-type hydrolase [Mariluticola halotolerans]UJQ95879.1 TIGR01459 family HAD-type hydrolase [Mariluticola halotolerans]